MFIQMAGHGKAADGLKGGQRICCGFIQDPCESRRTDAFIGFCQNGQHRLYKIQVGMPFPFAEYLPRIQDDQQGRCFLLLDACLLIDLHHRIPGSVVCNAGARQTVETLKGGNG